MTAVVLTRPACPENKDLDYPLAVEVVGTWGSFRGGFRRKAKQPYVGLAVGGTLEI